MAIDSKYDGSPISTNVHLVPVGALVLVANTWGAAKQMVIAARDLISN
jgi:hypothetical protein